jgi:hydrogenase expression/formation protein HypD
MRFVDEYRDAEAAKRFADQTRKRATRRWRIMEVCGGQTHTLIRYGIDEMLRECIDPIHGPGCPVCVTPLEKMDRAMAVAARPGVIFTTFGDMMRVPGSQTDLLQLKAKGADVRMVYSPTDALKLAEKFPDREVVFFAVGFETTAPANAMSVWLAKKKSLHNFSVLVSHVLVPPAVSAVLNDPDCQVQGFIAPGHVCTVMGYEEYEELADRYRVPFVVAGFEPLDLLEGISMLVDLLESGKAEVQNQYARSVKREGNPVARQILRDVFEISDMNWRGIGCIPGSGLRLREEYSAFDAEKKFQVERIQASESDLCIAGSVLQGKKKPQECPAFGTICTPEHPLGAPMVSNEGACAAYYSFRRYEEAPHAS